jgi:AraC family transcriptional regulator of adaptative response/methylated-DNA-[protein]-cysteine methyltransferase
MKPNPLIRYTLTDCALGRLLIAWTDRGVCTIKLGDSDRTLEAELRRQHARGQVDKEDCRSCPWVNEVKNHLEGRQKKLDVPVDLHGTPFQRQVWNELRRIPYGQTRTYRDIAVAVGKPNAARAVGQACGCNPVALIIPCHRVVASGGGLGGFGWGLDRKRFLLERESASMPSS